MSHTTEVASQYFGRAQGFFTQANGPQQYNSADTTQMLSRIYQALLNIQNGLTNTSIALANVADALAEIDSKLGTRR